MTGPLMNRAQVVNINQQTSTNAFCCCCCWKNSESRVSNNLRKTVIIKRIKPSWGHSSDMLKCCFFFFSSLSTIRWNKHIFMVFNEKWLKHTSFIFKLIKNISPKSCLPKYGEKNKNGNISSGKANYCFS